MPAGRRLYILQRPKIGSHRNPKPSKVKSEASPYYWWWRALTLNDDYIECCNNNGEGSMSDLYKDFGDVRFEGMPHIAFEKWWHTFVGDEIRGAYLFAEPLLENPMRYVADLDDAQDAMDDPTQVLISIPLNVTRIKLLKMVKRRIEALHSGKLGKEARSLSSSKARYIPISGSQPERLKEWFDVYLERKKFDEAGKIYDSALIAKRCKIEVKRKDEAIVDAKGSKTYELLKHSIEKEYNIKLTNKISKYNGYARNIIKNVGEGAFPKR